MQESQFQDRQLTCLCGKDFTYTAGEQQYFKDRGLNAPKRCPECRAERLKRKERNEMAVQN